MMWRFLTYLFFATFFLPGICRAQDILTQMQFKDILEYAEGKKNYEKMLVNGPAYAFNYKRSIGHPFFLENAFVSGEVVYSGMRFSEQQIKFNSFEQELVLQSEMDKSGREVLLPFDLVDEFTIGNHLFRKFSLFERDPAFYQVVAETKDITCLYLWTKPREVSNHVEGYLSYKFGEDKNKKYLLVNGEAGYFKNKRTYVALFPENARNRISDYLKKYKIKLKKIGEKDMSELILFSQDCLEQQESQP